MNMNARAIISGPLTERDLDDRISERAAVLDIADQLEREARERWDMHRVLAPTTCGGPCAQGRRACPCPDACRRKEDDENGFSFAQGLLTAIALVALCIGVPWALDWLFRALA